MASSSRQYEYFDDDPAFPSTLVISTLFVGAFIGFLNETLLNVALPTLMGEFSVDKTTVQWMVTGFMLVMGALAPLTASLVHPREVFADAIADRAASIIVVHNHPSGSMRPSQADIETTNRLKRAGELLGIPLMSHLLITKQSFRVID